MMPIRENTSCHATDPAGMSEDPASERSAVPQERERPHGIFLHTGWRSAGTWVWSRFRALESVRAFYEPLSNLLGDLSLADIPAVRPTSSSGHPPLGTPYYEEYRSFMQERGRGVVGYRKRFGIDRFGGVPDDEFPALVAYLQNLCDRSIDQGKMPVLKFCRSQGRLPWFKSAFPHAMHAVVLRNPASQFASGWLLKQEWNNPFFVAAPFRVLGLNQAEPIVKQVIETCEVSLPSFAGASVEEYAAACEQYAHTAEGSNAYRAFVALWILCASRIEDGADLVIDMDRLGQSPVYTSELRAQFRAQANVTPDFSGARDLVDETRRCVTRIKGIDGQSIRSINYVAQKFLLSQIDGSHDSQTGVAKLIGEKLSLADELSGQWR
ncbi:hypothetical protein P3T23_006764 [Paraburkholderia sp. GAS448]|jgi:hypothetical protein|uniref:hypothetical protein n=1 Tax=Paraburkholderia sp. GAS448 TaxID=3035136 RepID=UPI003D2198FC